MALPGLPVEEVGRKGQQRERQALAGRQGGQQARRRPLGRGSSAGRLACYPFQHGLPSSCLRVACRPFPAPARPPPHCHHPTPPFPVPACSYQLFWALVGCAALFVIQELVLVILVGESKGQTVNRPTMAAYIFFADLATSYWFGILLTVAAGYW